MLTKTKMMTKMIMTTTTITTQILITTTTSSRAKNKQIAKSYGQNQLVATFEYSPVRQKLLAGCWIQSWCLYT